MYVSLGQGVGIYIHVTKIINFIKLQKDFEIQKSGRGAPRYRSLLNGRFVIPPTKLIVSD